MKFLKANYPFSSNIHTHIRMYYLLVNNKSGKEVNSNIKKIHYLISTFILSGILHIKYHCNILYGAIRQNKDYK